MFDNIRRDFRLHDSSLLNRAWWAMIVYRYGRWSLARRWGVTRWLSGAIYIFAKLFSDILTNCNISRHAVIGEDFRIIKCGPLYIDAGVVIGDRCVVMHNVTIGACVTDDTPVLDDDVFIAAGVSVLGKVHMAEFAKATANALVVDDVPPHTVVAGVPAKAFADPSVFMKLKQQRDEQQPRQQSAGSTGAPKKAPRDLESSTEPCAESAVDQPQTS